MMQLHRYDAEAFKSWCLCSVVTLALPVPLILTDSWPLAVLLVVLGCLLHLVLLPAYLYRRKLGHPSWVMVPSLLPASAVYPLLTGVMSPEVFHTPGRLVLTTMVPLLLWVPFLVYKASKFKATLLVAGLVPVIAIAALLTASSRGQFFRDLHRIQPGMTVVEADAAMAGYIQDTADAPDGQMKTAGAREYRHSEDGAYSADCGIVRFENDRVESVTFFSRD